MMQYDMSGILRMAQSPAGRQLITLLQRSGGSDLQAAVDSASNGDYSQAQKAITSLLSDPEVKALLKQLEENQ